MIDRPNASVHPRYSDFIYKVAYYFDGCCRNRRLVGTDEEKGIDAIMCIVDLMKRDSEIKIYKRRIIHKRGQVHCTNGKFNI